jgi:hypothetical protein
VDFLAARAIYTGFSGIPCRKGPFTKEEVGKIQAALDMYQKVRHSVNRIYCIHTFIGVKENNLDDEELDDLVHSSQSANGFWSYLGPSLLR